MKKIKVGSKQRHMREGLDDNFRDEIKERSYF